MSILELLLIIVYTALLSAVILRTNLFRSEFVSRGFLVKLFILKILVAFLYAYIHFENGWMDTFVMFVEAKKITKLFIDDPDLYFKMVFGHVERADYPEVYNRLGVEKLDKYLRPRSQFMVRINAILMPFSYGFYSVQTVLFEFLSLLGIFHIYQFISKKITFNNPLLKLFLFFAPSILFWLSGMHKDGLTVFGFGLLLFSIDQISTKKYGYLFLLVFSLVFSFFVRDYALLIFLPALLSFLIARQLGKKILLPYIFIYGLSSLFFFGGDRLSPKFNFPERFVSYQRGFMELQGESNFEMVLLEPTVESFATSVPVALFNTLFKPNFSQTHTLWAAIAAAENIIYVVLGFLMLAFLSTARLSNSQKALILFMLLFGLTFFLMLGLIVDNIGAIVRYKTTPLIFLGSAIILLFDVEKFERFFGIKNKLLSKHVNQQE